MMKNTFTFLVAVISLTFERAYSSSVIEPKLCLKVTDALGFVKEDGRVAEEGKLQGDMNEVSKLPVLDAAFARPSRITVCADGEFVHSIMLSLKVH